MVFTSAVLLVSRPEDRRSITKVILTCSRNVVVYHERIKNWFFIQVGIERTKLPLQAALSLPIYCCLNTSKVAFMARDLRRVTADELSFCESGLN